MGFTHYYRTYAKEFSQGDWNVFIKDIQKLLANLPEHSDSSGGYHRNDPLLLNGCSRSKTPIVNETEVWFNGTGGDDLGHETFALSRLNGGKDFGAYSKKGERPAAFAFCKTARKPYDLAVQAALILYKRHFGEDVSVSSDGDSKEWASAAKLVLDLFDYETKFGKEENEEFIVEVTKAKQMILPAIHPHEPDASLI
jgi:hypothetical protein